MNRNKLDMLGRIDWAYFNGVLYAFELMEIHAEPWNLKRLKDAWIRGHAASEWTKLVYVSMRIEAGELCSAENRQLSALIELIWALKALADSEHAEDMYKAMKALTYAMDIPDWIRPVILDVIDEDESE